MVRSQFPKILLRLTFEDRKVGTTTNPIMSHSIAGVFGSALSLAKLRGYSAGNCRKFFGTGWLPMIVRCDGAACLTRSRWWSGLSRIASSTQRSGTHRRQSGTTTFGRSDTSPTFRSGISTRSFSSFSAQKTAANRPPGLVVRTRPRGCIRQRLPPQRGVSLPDAPLQTFRVRAAGLPRTTEAERLVVQRIGQDIFRKSLLEYWKHLCPLTGFAEPALLRASHIVRWAECDDDARRLDVYNGLLALRALGRRVRRRQGQFHRRRRGAFSRRTRRGGAQSSPRQRCATLGGPNAKAPAESRASPAASGTLSRPGTASKPGSKGRRDFRSLTSRTRSRRPIPRHSGGEFVGCTRNESEQRSLVKRIASPVGDNAPATHAYNAVGHAKKFFEIR